jgi:hypothetical protein
MRGDYWKLFEKLRKNTHAFTGIVVAAVTSLVVGVILLAIGVYIEAALYSAIPKAVRVSGSSANINTTNATMLSVFNAGYSAFGMGTIIPIVIVAAAIISIIIGAFVYRSNK